MSDVARQAAANIRAKASVMKRFVTDIEALAEKKSDATPLRAPAAYRIGRGQVTNADAANEHVDGRTIG